MAIIRAISTMQAASGVPEDASVNVFHYGIVTPGSEGATVLAAWQTFMRAIYTIFPSTVATTGHSLRLYDLADPQPRAPYYTGAWSFSAALTGSPLPSEVAICTSFQGARVSGQSQARRRGRMYLGPLDTGVMSAAGRFDPTQQATIATAMKTLVDSLESSSITFGVYSPTDNALVTVENGWVDNAFDVQRRRGIVSTVRSLWEKA